jgi:hypothetical protein
MAQSSQDAPRGLKPSTVVGVAALLACGSTLFVAVGAPPSTASPTAGFWLSLEPSMPLSLWAGVAFSLAALVAALWNPTTSAQLCLLGLIESGAGAMIALGVEGRLALQPVLVLAVILGLPAAIVVKGARQVREERFNEQAG